ncbi:hypothetical protein [Endozoicomonas sp. ONNA2]|uniref:hypothetical protein n=1 Tax=Endozoicomonas sp. ONNA2 TaxID=2828741 RepID=UPI00214943CE|nr:hypothetical protein [Endozoicomonas sp. ONNA2]
MQQYTAQKTEGPRPNGQSELVITAEMRNYSLLGQHMKTYTLAILAHTCTTCATNSILRYTTITANNHKKPARWLPR